MSMVGENQVRHFYVAGAFPEHASISALRAGAKLDLAALKPDGSAIANNSEFVLALKNNKGTITLSDVVNPKNVSYAKSIKFAAKTPTVINISDIPVVANKLYTIAIVIAGYGSLSVENEYIKEGFYKSKSTDTVEDIVDGLIQSLARNFHREQPQLGTMTTYTKKGGIDVKIHDNVAFAFSKTALDGAFEVSTITVTAAATVAGTATVSLNGVTVNLPLTASDIATNAQEIADAIDALPGYSAVSNGVDKVTITAGVAGAQTDIATFAAGTATSAAATLAVVTQGAATTDFGIAITEKDWLPEYYVTGKKSKLFLDFKVDVFFPGETLPTVAKTGGVQGSGTGYQVRNMEYYFLGNRQDSMRGMGYPHNFEAVYDSKLDGQYHLIEIGYWDESRDEPMKSKKQITVAIESLADANKLIAEINKSLLATGIVVATLV